MSGSDESGKFRCCCSCCHIKNSTYGIAIISLVLIIVNFVLKAFGYSQIDWNWELLFFIVDGLAVLSLFYGIYSEKASFLQPFAVLSIFTVSFLALLAAFCGTAIYDSKSYAAEWFEMELRKRMDAGKHLRFNLTFSDLVWISSSVGICCLVLLTALHAWFLVLVVKCAQFFRFLETQTKSDIESQE
ncbi:hypothetical protein L596_015663 [Steinernema carpocapsae]|uniref:MARVEL domain-containing protein n=1 Tax=Steinernema carpocapsae TaxID=34508 RepID=A0A4U5NFT9_STECR|nr:hypothetical protein L596_015663 [Steinernema carpocapsae]